MSVLSDFLKKSQVFNAVVAKAQLPIYPILSQYIQVIVEILPHFWAGFYIFALRSYVFVLSEKQDNGT